MTEDQPVSRAEALDSAQRAADHLALALEDAGFDVGREFPTLHGRTSRDGQPVVDLGQISAEVAVRLASALLRGSAPDAKA